MSLDLLSRHRNEKCHENYTTDFIHKLYSSEGKGIFDCRVNVLGHLQQVAPPHGGLWVHGLRTGVDVCNFVFVSFIQLLSIGCREGRLLPSTETLALSWVWGPSSGSPRNCLKILKTVRLWHKRVSDRTISPELQLTDGHFLVPLPDHVFANSPDTACVLGLNKKVVSFTPVTELKAVTDFE